MVAVVLLCFIWWFCIRSDDEVTPVPVNEVADQEEPMIIIIDESDEEDIEQPADDNEIIPDSNNSKPAYNS